MAEGTHTGAHGAGTDAGGDAPPKPAKTEKLPPSTDIVEVAPGVLRLQLPLNMPGLGHVNCYAMEDERGVALVDPGLPGPGSYTALKRGLTSAGLSVERVHTVVVTHSHPDHYGNAARLRKAFGAEVVTHQSFKTWWDPMEEDDRDKELATTDAHRAEHEAAVERRAKSTRDRRVSFHWDRPTPWGGDHPAPPRKMRWKYATLGRAFNHWYRPPRPSRGVADAEPIMLAGREWVSVHTPGHTHDHLCLFDPTEGALITGDHVLPGITPHISGLVRLENPLSEFFDSLRKVAGLSPTVGLPAHGELIPDISQRVDDIICHHDERMDLLREAAGEHGEATVAKFSEKLFRPQVWGAMADSETYAHLEHLRLTGQASRRNVEGKLVYDLN